MKVSLESLCTLLTDGTHYTPPNIGEGYPFLTVADMRPNALNFETCSRISKNEFAEADRQNSAPKPGDVLFSKDGTVGKVHVVNGEGPFAVLSSIAIIRPNPQKLDPNYLAHFLQSPAAVSAADRSKTGSALRRIILKDIKRLQLAAPPLPEQRRIAAILDQADALRRLRRQSLTRLADLGQAIFYEMFGDPIQNPKRLAVAKLASLTLGKNGVKAGPFGSALKKEDYSDSGYRIYGQEQVISGCFEGNYYIDSAKFNQLKSCEVKADDLLVSLVGSFGKTLIVPRGLERGIINPRLLKITPDLTQVIPRYLAIYLGTPAVQAEMAQLSHGGTMGILNAGIVKDIGVMVPPLGHQKQFEAVMIQLDDELAKHSARLTVQDSLFTSLQHRAFDGEL